jgi:competence protein ComGC
MKSEKGTTLTELVITIALTSIILGVVAALVFQLSTVSESGNNKLLAVHELQNASYWFNCDGQMASSATIGANNLMFNNPTGISVVYSWSGDKLTRTANASVMTLAQNISSASFTIQNQLVSMNLTSTVSGRTIASENFNFKVNMRALP